MSRIPVMEAVVDVLESEGVDTVFGIPGAAILPLYAALARRSETIRHLTMRHEEAGTRRGRCMGTGHRKGRSLHRHIRACWDEYGDGSLHRAGRFDSHPVYYRAGCVGEAAPGALPGRRHCLYRPASHEVGGPSERSRPGTMDLPRGLPGRTVRKTGPVLIDLPLDVAKSTIEWDRTIDRPLEVHRVKPNPAGVERALQLMLQAKRPLLLAGGGVILAGGSPELRELAERTGIPVQVTLMGKGAFPEDHPLFAGMTGIQTTQRFGNASFLEADLVVAVGARFADRHTGDLAVYRGARRFVHVDVDATQIGRVFPPDLGVVSDAKLFLAELCRLADGQGIVGRWPTWADRVGELRETLVRRDDFDDVPIKAPRVFREVNEIFGRKATFVTAIGLYQNLVGPVPKGLPTRPVPRLRSSRSSRMGSASRDRR